MPAAALCLLSRSGGTPMSTRGLISATPGEYVYNHSDSYPTGLGQEIADRLHEGDYETFREEIISGRFTDQDHPDFLHIKGIDYLFHEYVYVLDFVRKRWSAYDSVWDPRERKKPVECWDTSKGRLKAYFEDVDFATPVRFEERYGKPDKEGRRYISHYVAKIG